MVIMNFFWYSMMFIVMVINGMPAKASDKAEYNYADKKFNPSYSDEARTKLADGVINGPWNTCVGWRETKPCPITFTFPQEKKFSKVKIFALGIDSGGGIGTPLYIRVYSGDKVEQSKLIGEIELKPQKKGWIEIPIKSGILSNLFTIDMGDVLNSDKGFIFIMISEIVFE